LGIPLHSLANLSSCVFFIVTEDPEDLLSMLTELQEAVHHWLKGQLGQWPPVCRPLANQVSCIFAVTLSFPCKGEGTRGWGT
jgi:hypothetical protein